MISLNSDNIDGHFDNLSESLKNQTAKGARVMKYIILLIFLDQHTVEPIHYIVLQTLL